MNDLQEELGTEVHVAAVVVSSSPESVRRTIDEENLQYPIYFGPRVLSSRYRVDSLPTTYVVNKSGIIVDSSAGFTAGWEMKRMLTAALE